MNLEEEVTALRAEVAALRAKADPRPSQPEITSVDTILALALEKMENDADKAANLFYAWTEQSSEVRESLKPLIREAIDRRLAALAETKP